MQCEKALDVLQRVVGTSRQSSC